MAAKNRPIRIKADNDTGLSAKVQSRNQRSIRNDGSFNIQNRGTKWIRVSDIYLNLVTMPWWKFNLTVFTTYILINTFFALIYYEVGTNYLTNIEGISEWEKFLDTFFFSAQSLTTVGYGRVAPVGLTSSSIAAFESLIGLLGFALATGLLYGRFSKASAKITHSKNMLIAPYLDGTGLMFRIANMRETQLAEVEVQVTFSKVVYEGGREVRRFYPLNLERTKIAMFPLSWTIVHPINEQSPIYGKTKDDLEKEDMEILVYLKAHDETYSQDVRHRISYRASDIIWGAKFIINFESKQDGPTIHYLNRINDYEAAELPKMIRVAPSGDEQTSTASKWI